MEYGIRTYTIRGHGGRHKAKCVSLTMLCFLRESEFLYIIKPSVALMSHKNYAKTYDNQRYRFNV